MTEEINTVRPIIFVGGAPRSGTTVTHALLCTSDRTSPYHPEISFVRPLFNAYSEGMRNWKSHTNSFFKEHSHFDAHMRFIVLHSLDHIAKVQGNPEILCVKDPLLTPLFSWVQQLIGDQVRFVTVVRNPYDVVRSRQGVVEKTGRVFTAQNAESAANEYMRSYAHIDDHTLQAALFVLKYEDLMAADVISALREFTGCNDISPDKVWAEQHQANETSTKDPWFSPKYLSPINTESRFDPLAQKFRAVVDKTCASIMDRFGYARG